MLKLLVAACLAFTSRGSPEALHESTCTALDVKHAFAAMIQHHTSLGRSGKLFTRRLYAEWDPGSLTSNGTPPIDASASLLRGASPIPINASNTFLMPDVDDVALPNSNSSIPRTLANESARNLININSSMDALEWVARWRVAVAGGASGINNSIPEAIGNASGRNFVNTNASDTDASAANESEGAESSNNASSSEDSSSDAESEEAKAKRRKRNMMIFGSSTALPILCLLFGGSTFGDNHADAAGGDSDDYWGAQKNVGM